MTSLVLRGLLPLDTAGSQAAALILGVGFQEGLRYGCFKLHRRLVASLNRIAGHMEGVRQLNAQDEQLLALGQGWAHAATHSIFFYYSWLPLYLGDATLYLEACPRMSFFLAGALLTLGFNLLHTASMALAFSGWARKRRERWIAVPCAHLLAALLTLSNLRRNGCLGGIPMVLLLGVGSVAAAGVACWKDVQELPPQAHSRLPAEEPPSAQDSAM